MTPDVVITEVGPRDGLQNERVLVPTAAKIAFIDGLARAGLTRIECSSFVHPKRVPAMSDAEKVFRGLDRKTGVQYLALVPNMRGYERARAVGCDAIASSSAISASE